MNILIARARSLRSLMAASMVGFGVACLQAAAQSNAWTSPASGNWQDPDWSLGMLPVSGQDIQITNAGWKAVAIQPSTASNFPKTLDVNSVTIMSPTNGFNTLLLNFAGSQRPLVIGDSNNPGSLVVGSGSAVAMFSSGLTVNNAQGTNGSHLGAFEVGGTFTESEGSEVTAAFLHLTGTYDLTNSLLSVPSESISGQFNQQGGTNAGLVDVASGGQYNLFEGVVQGGVSLNDDIAGVFYQWGGTNLGGVGLGGAGMYQLSGGLLVSGDLEVGPSYLAPSSLGAGDLVQTGGTNSAGNIMMGVGSYSLEGGVLIASGLSLPTAGNRLGFFGTVFNQSGGRHTNGGIIMQGVVDERFGLSQSTYNLSGGTLETPSISAIMGLVNQTGGTNRVGVLTLNEVSSYILNSGFLVVSNLDQEGGSAFSLIGSIQQSGGTNDVLGTLSVGGGSSYNFTNGLLIADDVEVTGGAVFLHAGGSFAGHDNITLSDGGWTERTAGETLGTLRLGSGGSTNSFLNLPSNACILRFADSSEVAWAGGSGLTIQNWSGSTNGGGLQQVFFGTSASGLMQPQLNEVQFSNPVGLQAGTYEARILADGEIVPGSAASLPPSLGISAPINGVVTVTLSGSAGSRYEIEFSTNFQNWTVLTNETATNGTFSVVDTGITNQPLRFYRALLAP